MGGGNWGGRVAPVAPGWSRNTVVWFLVTWAWCNTTYEEFSAVLCVVCLMVMLSLCSLTLLYSPGSELKQSSDHFFGNNP